MSRPPRIVPTPIQKIAQKQPTTLKVGSILYMASGECDEPDDPVSTRIVEWHVSSIKRKRASDVEPTIYVTAKVDGSTWGKVSSKIGDYGWLKPIDPVFRRSFERGEYLGRGFATTQEKALALAIEIEKENRRRYEAWEYQDSVICSDRIIAALERRRKGLRTKKAKTSPARREAKN